MNLDFNEQQESLRAELRSLLADVLPEDWVGLWYEHNGQSVSAVAVQALAAKGWLTLSWPPEYGGAGASLWDQAVIQEELFAHHEPRGGQYMGLNWIGPTIMQFGTDAQKSELLPEIAAGKTQWAQLYSEPEAGSDLAHLRTMAVRVDGGFIVTGEKVWTSYANSADRGFLLARTNKAEKGYKGISAFVISMDLPGIEVREFRSSIGWHRLHSVRFNDVHIPEDALLGDLNRGWAVAMASLPFERLGNARYARTTRIIGILRNLVGSSFERFAEDFADCLALGRAAELSNYFAIAAKDKDEDLGCNASLAFAMNANYEKRVAELAEHILQLDVVVAAPDAHAPAHGEVESFAIRQAPTVGIQAGTYQVQLSLIGQLGLRLPKAR